MNIKTIARWAVYIPLFIIPFLSLYVANGSYFPFITGKNFAFRILVEIAVGGWVVLAIADKKYRPKFSLPLVFYGLMVLWLLVADALALNAHKALWSNFERMDGWVTLIHALLLFVVAGSVFSADNLWRKWWLAFIGSSALVSLYGFAQMAGIKAIHQSADRIDATLGNAEYLAGYLLFAIAITLWQAFETRDRSYVWLKYALFVLAALELVVLFQTGTRGTLFALIGAGAFGAVLWMLEAGKQGRKGAFAVFAILVLIVGGLFVARDSAFVHNSPNLDRLASAFSLKKALGTRITIWHMAIEGIQERPILGWGQEGYNYIFNKYYEPSLYGQEPWFDRAHNIFLDWAVAGGIPALLLFLGLLITTAYSLYRAPVSRAERIFLLSALVGYCIQGLVVFDNLFTYIPFAMIVALAHSMRSRPIAQLERLPDIGRDTVAVVIAPSVLVVTCLVIWFVNVPTIRASGDLIRALSSAGDPTTELSYFKEAAGDHSFAHQEIAEQAVQFASQAVSDQTIAEATRIEIVQFALDQMQKEIARAPEDARLHLQYALLLRSIGQYQQALAESSRALELSPRKQTILFEQGIEQIQLGDIPAAEKAFTTAYNLNTNYSDAAAYVAASRIMQRDVVGGKKILQASFGTTTVDQQILFLAYYQIQDWNDLIILTQARLAKNNDATTAYQLAAIYAQAGRTNEARAQVRATMSAHPETASQGTALLTQLGVKQ